MADGILNSVNEHCLDSVMMLAETTAVSAAEDIYDAHGTKLLAKGAIIATAMKDRLVRHKLRKPLETSLRISEGLTAASVLAEAESLLEQVPALVVFMGDRRASIFETLSLIPLHSAAALLLTAAEKSREGSFRHGVLVAMIAVALAAQHRLPHNLRAMLALAGLLHDIGELYIRPDLLNSQRQLKLQEWKHVAAHPRIGQVVLDELTDYPQTVIDAVAGHHERFDGSGYPRQLSGDQISTAAQVLSVAETLSGIVVRKEDVLIRSCLALKCVPGEHPHELVSAFSALRRSYAGAPFPFGVAEAQCIPKTQEVIDTLARAFAECERLVSNPALHRGGSILLDRARTRLDALGRALTATGIEVCFAHGYVAAFTPEDREAFLEIDVVGHELSWRLRDIARDLYLRLEDHTPEIKALFAELIGILDNPVEA